MLGNNLSTLGVSSGQLNNKIDTLSSSLVWMPTTKEFGVGFGDFETHQTLATRLALHYTHSIEDKQAQPNTDAFENTQIRLSDGTVVFTPNIFGPGITVNELRLSDEPPWTGASSITALPWRGSTTIVGSISSRDPVREDFPIFTTPVFNCRLP